MAHHKHSNLGVTITDDVISFRVWAPFAKSVAVSIMDNGWHDTAMVADDNGYWSATTPDAVIGQTYQYVIETNDGKKLNKIDPYAKQLTQSDGGLGVISDPSFEWGDADFTLPAKEQQIIYELHIGTFNRPDASTSGTFDTAIEKLDYLQNLGVNVIELMPITSFAFGSGWGYAPNHIFSVEESYGGRHGLLEFVKACHDRGIGVLLDVVYNHFYKETVNGIQKQTDLWQFDGWSENNRGGIYFYNDPRGDTPWGGRPDYGRPQVRQFLLDNVAMWFSEYRIDGLRVDSTIYMRNTKGPEGGIDTSIPEAWTLLQEITDLAHKITPYALVTAEDSSGEPKITTSIKDGGLGFDSQWGLGFPHALRKSLGLEGDQSVADLAGELQHLYNNDTYQKIVFSDSHDTAANGSVRLNEAASPGNATNTGARKQAIVANAVMLTAPGIPMFLQGSEFLQAGAFNEYEMLEWENTKQFAGIVLAHKHLIDLRLNTYGNTAGLQGHSLNVFHQDASNFVMAYHRFEKGGKGDDTIIIVNFGAHKHHRYDVTFPIPGTWQLRFNSSWKGYSSDFYETHQEAVTTDEHGVATLALADYSVVIFSQD